LTSIRKCRYVHVLMLRPSTARLEVQPAAKLFKALGDETRLRIVALLSHGELCVCHVQEALGLSQPNASRQLAVLRNAGVVEARREGTWTYYRLARQPDAVSERQLHALVRSFSQQAVLKKDVERLLRVRGPSACE
jgi:ArsR family transcriptional regulator